MVTHRVMDAASFGEMGVGIVGRMKTKTKTHGVRGQGCIPLSKHPSCMSFMLDIFRLF